MTSSLLYIFESSKISVFGIVEKKLLNTHELKLNQPLRTLIYFRTESSAIFVCINSCFFVFLDDIMTFKYINMGIFLDQNSRTNFTSMIAFNKDLRLYGEI